MVVIVKEPIAKKVVTGEKSSFGTMVCNAVVTPIEGMKSLFTRKRTSFLKFMILLQLFCFFIYWIIIEINVLKYLYMLLVFDGFDETDYAYYTVFYEGTCAVYLMIVMPFLNTKLKLHDAAMLTLIVVSHAVCDVVSGFATSMWLFYVATALGSFGLCKYSVVRDKCYKTFFAAAVNFFALV